MAGRSTKAPAVEGQSATGAETPPPADTTPAPVTPAAATEPAEVATEDEAGERYIVTGAAVVLPTSGGSERYLYRGAVIADGYTESGIAHALSLGLIEAPQ